MITMQIIILYHCFIYFFEALQLIRIKFTITREISTGSNLQPIYEDRKTNYL